MSSTSFQIVLIFFLLAASAFFSGSETALLKLSKIKVKHWIYSHPFEREAWTNWLSNPEKLITTILIGNTLVNIFLSSVIAIFAMNAFHEFSQEWVQTFAGIAAFFLTLVFGEIVPKIYARQNAEKISSIVLGPLFNLSKFLSTPLEKLLKLPEKIFPILKQSTPGRVSTLTLDEIRSIIQDKTSLKGLEEENQDMMRRVLEMHQTTVSQIMTSWKNVDFLTMDEALSGGKKLEHFIDQWVESGHTRLPVVIHPTSWAGKVGAPQLIGYLYLKDLFSCITQEKKIEPSLCQKWVRELPRIPPEKKTSELLNFFKFGSPIACVVDRLGFPLGIVTLEDILEEFIGEILDEYDLEERQNEP